MKVVVNTTPIISLASIGQLPIVEKLFGNIIIAEAVYFSRLNVHLLSGCCVLSINAFKHVE